MGPNHISDTALWIAELRARETARPDGLFKDAWAKVLSGDRGAEIARDFGSASLLEWTIAVRTRVLDDMILSAVRDHGVRTVVNLAAGLDTRPYRLKELPADIHWIEADFKEVLDYKSGVLAQAKPVCQLERTAADLSTANGRKAVWDRMSGETMVVTEGLLIYLERASVESLAHEITEVAQHWVLDWIGPAVLPSLQRRWRKQLTQAHAQMQFAPTEGLRFFEPLGWRVRDYRGTVAEAIRLGRAPLWAWPLGRITSRTSGIAWLELTEAG